MYVAGGKYGTTKGAQCGHVRSILHPPDVTVKKSQMRCSKQEGKGHFLVRPRFSQLYRSWPILGNGPFNPQTCLVPGNYSPSIVLYKTLLPTQNAGAENNNKYPQVLKLIFLFRWIFFIFLPGVVRENLPRSFPPRNVFASERKLSRPFVVPEYSSSYYRAA